MQSIVLTASTEGSSDIKTATVVATLFTKHRVVMVAITMVTTVSLFLSPLPSSFAGKSSGTPKSQCSIVTNNRQKKNNSKRRTAGVSVEEVQVVVVL